MPWIELAADISGVCRVAGTLPMTSMPTSSASTKMVRSVTRAVDIASSLGSQDSAASSFATAGWTTSPPCVTTTPAWISSVVSIASAPVC